MRFIKSESYFPAIILIHLVLWAVDLSFYDGSLALVEGEAPGQRVLGEILSSWVVTVFGFNLLMTTRARWVERVFGGLDKMYLIHRRSGVIAGVLLLLHFGVVPRHPEFTIGKPMGLAALALIVLGVAFAAAPVMKRKIAYNKWVVAHRLMGLFYLVGIGHALLVETLISRLPLIRTYVLGMAMLGVGSWIYRAFLFRLLRRPKAYRVEDVRRFGQSTVEIRMVPEGAALDHRAGQFAFFSFPKHGSGELHPFTIASAPGDPALRIAVKACGDFTSALARDVEAGDSVSVEGPYGHLTRDHFDAQDQVWIAGGIGITPFLSLARSLSGKDAKVRLVWSVRTQDEAYFDEELRSLAERNDRFEYELWQSNAKGYLSVAGTGGAAAFQQKAIVICGPVALRDGLITQLRRTGIKARQIHTEEFAFR